MEFLAGVLIGMTTGTAQWLILRREVYWAGWWYAISVVGWTTGMARLPGVILTGVMVGVVTGIAVELLLRYPKPVEDKVVGQVDLPTRCWGSVERVQSHSPGEHSWCDHHTKQRSNWVTSA